MAGVAFRATRADLSSVGWVVPRGQLTDLGRRRFQCACTTSCLSLVQSSRPILVAFQSLPSVSADAPSSCTARGLAPELPLSIHVALNHVTHYRYDRRVALSPQIVRLRPAPHSRTRILSYSMKVTPETHFINWQQDPQSNYLARLVFPDKTEELRIEVDLVAEMAVLNPFDFFLEPYAEQVPVPVRRGDRRELAPYLITQPLTPRFAELPGGDSARGAEHHRLPRRAEHAALEGHPVSHPHGARRADAGRDAGERVAARAATRAGCSCSSCGRWGSLRASSPGISSSSSRM